MNAFVAKEEIALLMPNSLSHYFRDEDAGLPATASVETKSGVLARLGAVGRWLAQAGQRRMVMDELRGLSDHELADIGLARAELGLVFDTGFASQRNAERFGARRAAA
ncbi:MAG: DUF1127 domain-containing protein [Rhodospirillales bacterium]|nr:DUF1127 domain-containing protein [Rhodospirillales bacterium]MDE2200330.1 DUF1127 domain-containing protein [Rhodospirillales bacterium]MDE2576088.1 DUF1127 domain-containing protein [Rhodospirillales bacterium]